MAKMRRREKKSSQLTAFSTGINGENTAVELEIDIKIIADDIIIYGTGLIVLIITSNNQINK